MFFVKDFTRNSWVVKVWKEGRHFDLWYVNHFLAGILLGCLVIFLKLEFWMGFIVSVVLMLAWEVFELVTEIEETKFNMAFDVIFSVFSYFFTIFLLKNYLSPPSLLVLFYVSLVIFAILEL